MAGPARALTLDDLGAWLVKARGSEASTSAHVSAGFAEVGSWCVRPSYRTALVRAGQPVLLWVSGTEREMPAGLYARGVTTGPAASDVVPMALEPLEHPVLRSELVAHPGLAAMEVLRMPAGSNPSYVTRAQLRLLGELSPELAAWAARGSGRRTRDRPGSA
ncbi:hypothetical protein [Nocardioides sp. SYSU D00065]|uniref:hypothetical protein n=1 Tax=Nocardioides sp. SYSU D00065 TaxID=2817378 RepID=UPI001B339837|nr:hypothetical protein [Nocardioides sp. SYSU D00065]